MSPSAPRSQKTWDPTLMVNRHLIPAAEKHSCILTLPFTMQLILGDDNFIFCWLGKYKIAQCCCWDHQSVCIKIFILSAIKVSTSTTHNTRVQAPDICPVIDLQNFAEQMAAVSASGCCLSVGSFLQSQFCAEIKIRVELSRSSARGEKLNVAKTFQLR